MARGRVRVIPIIIFVAFALYYVSTHREEVPITGRTQLVDIDRQQEAALGIQAYQQILSESEVVASGPEVDLVRGIGQRLVVAAADVDPGFEWEFNVIASEQANAFCLPGGKVAVFTGILPVVENENGLAVVMGHEIAHAIARHGAERMAYQRLSQLGQLAAGAALSDMDPGTQRVVMGALGVGTQFGVLLPFSREHESEADYMGLLFVARACYDPSEAPKLWERMGQAAGGRAPSEFMSTHPSHETRIRQFGEWMPEALTLRGERCRE